MSISLPTQGTCVWGDSTGHGETKPECPLLSPSTAAPAACEPRACVLQGEKPLRRQAGAPQPGAAPALCPKRQPALQRRPSATKDKNRLMIKNKITGKHDTRWIPGLGISPGKGNQFSCLGNPIDRETAGLQSLGSQRVNHDRPHTNAWSRPD